MISMTPDHPQEPVGLVSIAIDEEVATSSFSRNLEA
jgi:hypothetical protein